MFRSPILSVPTTRTSRKQKGKSRTLKAKYTPTADQPYSLESFFSLWLSDNDSWAGFASAVLLFLAEKRMPRREARNAVSERAVVQVPLYACVLRVAKCGAPVLLNAREGLVENRRLGVLNRCLQSASHISCLVIEAARRWTAAKRKAGRIIVLSSRKVTPLQL